MDGLTVGSVLLEQRPKKINGKRERGLTYNEILSQIYEILHEWMISNPALLEYGGLLLFFTGWK